MWRETLVEPAVAKVVNSFEECGDIVRHLYRRAFAAQFTKFVGDVVGNSLDGFAGILLPDEIGCELFL